MKRTALAPAVLIAAATAAVGLGAASAAQAAPACATPTVAISPSQNVASGQQVTVTGHNWGCNTKLRFVYVNATYTGEPTSQLGNGPRVPIASDGSFTYEVKTSGPAGAKWTVTVNPGDKDAKSATITLTGGSGVEPTAVPAGHVNPTAGSGANATTEWGVAALGGAGLALIGGGLTVGRRRSRAPHRSRG